MDLRAPSSFRRLPMNTSFKAFVLVVALRLLVSASAYAAFGYTDNGSGYVVDSGAGLVFEVRKTDGTLTSIVFNGVEYNGQRISRKPIAEGDIYRICDHEVRFTYR